MAETSVLLTDVVAISGGGIDQETALSHKWLCDRKEYDGQKFVEINKSDPHFKKFVMHKYDMYNHLFQLRSEEVEKRMKQLQTEGGEDDDAVDRPLKRPKRELFDQLVADA